MNINAIVKTVKFATSRTSLQITKHTPEILTYGGLISMTAGAIFGAKKSFRYMELVSEPELAPLADIAQAREASDAGKLVEEYTQEEERRDKFIVYSRLLVRTVKYYAIPIGLFVGGAAAVIYGHSMIAKRLAATTAAYSALELAYDNLKGRLEDTAPDVYDEVMASDVKMVEDEKATIDSEKSISSNPYEYAFDERNPRFNLRSDSANELILESARNYANDLLWSRGHVFLNEVLESLGMEHTPEGAVTGWVLDSKEGDSRVEFGECGTYDLKLDSEIPNVHTYTLNFNVDGLIWDRI